MEKFDFKKFLKENKSTFHSSLSEEEKTTSSKITKEELKAKIKEMFVAEMNEAADSAVPDDSTDMADIKEASTDTLKMMDGLVDRQAFEMLLRGARNIIRSLKDEDFEEDDIHDYLVYLVTTLDDSALTSKPKEIPGFEGTRDALDSLNIREEEEEEEVDTEEEVDAEVDTDMDVEDPEPSGDGSINVNQNADADLTGAEKETQDNLEAALEAAKKIGDQKLVDQIGNSLTFFTRQHVVK